MNIWEIIGVPLVLVSLVLGMVAGAYLSAAYWRWVDRRMKQER